MFVGKGKDENKILKEFVWTTIFKIFSQKYLVVRKTTRSQFLVVLTQFLVVEDPRILLPCCIKKKEKRSILQGAHTGLIFVFTFIRLLERSYFRIFLQQGLINVLFLVPGETSI